MNDLQKNAKNFTIGTNYKNILTSGITVIFILMASSLLANDSKHFRRANTPELNIKTENTPLYQRTHLPKAKRLLAKALVSEGDPSRLQAVFAKAQKGEKMVIGAIGGSITRAGAKVSIDKRYANVVLAWWEKNFPKANFELINAGIGSTRSDYGAMRLNQDLLSKSPDLVILEFACNDLDTPEYAESYEGMVRQILNSKNKPALLLLFMTRKDGSNVQDPEIRIGTHYNLPMISYRNAIWDEMQTGRLRWEQICPDEVHPNESGHGLAGNLICETLKKALRKSDPKHISSINTPLPAPLFSDSFEFTALFDGDSLIPVTNKGWIFDGSKKDNAGWKSSKPESVIEFEITGRQIYLSFWKIKGAMGKAKITIDGNNPIVTDAWFDQTWGGYRNMERIGTNLKAGKHRIRVELLADKNENSTGNEFRVLCLGSTEVGHKL